MSDIKVPFFIPSIGDEEINEVVQAIKSGWITTGPKAKKFEDDFARYTGAKHAISVNSATAGLHLSLESAGVRRGDKVITTPYTFTATAEVIRYLGADPLFVDIDPYTFNIDPEKIETAVKKNSDVKAIIPVHIGGLVCDMDPILDIAKKYNLKIIEDSAHALPAEYNGRKAGTIGDFTVFSFYANKNITTGEGGMITTDNDDYASRLRKMRLHGIDHDAWERKEESAIKASWYYEVVAPGFKYNMNDISAAIGIHQLARADGFRAAREKIARRYDDAFEKMLPNVKPAYYGLQGSKDDDFYSAHSWQLYILNVEDTPCGRDRFIQALSSMGVSTSVHFRALHLHRYWKEKYNLEPEDFPVALSLYKRSVSLPIYPAMTDEMVDKVIKSVLIAAKN